MGLCGGCWHAAHIMSARLFLQCGLLEQPSVYVRDGQWLSKMAHTRDRKRKSVKGKKKQKTWGQSRYPWIIGNQQRWRLSLVSSAERCSQTVGWFGRPGAMALHTAIKESVAELSLSKLFNLSPRGEQRKTQCCAWQDYSAQCSCGWVKGSL